MLTVNFVLMTICVTMTGAPRQNYFCVELSVTIFQVPLSQINAVPRLSSQLQDPSQRREEDKEELVTKLQELRNDQKGEANIPITSRETGALINVVLSSILKLTFLINVLITKCSDVCGWWWWYKCYIVLALVTLTLSWTFNYSE